ncbi:hypothetical protein JRO89_XS05G0024200 [Xanthoceras sorbifolium]|uniref:Zinc finger, CCHC-type n=1 Tax=Xanthoceras sorbifolium TaxID=99658 RepID=A0ABQ8I011_9ROSI|nr:hypothetical protein JRO89_XS05G0024200 [Xanthoceras sorbifolium]
MQQAKSIVETIGLMDAPVGDSYLVIHILRSLNPEFKEIIDPIHARETLIDFEELHEKLLNYEGSLKREAARTNDNPITPISQPNRTKTSKAITLSQKYEIGQKPVSGATGRNEESDIH